MKLLIALAFCCSFFGGVAKASDCPPEMAVVNACAAYEAAADAPLATTAKRQASDPEVSCLEVRARAPSVLLVYEGPYVQDVDSAGVRVITRFRQMNDWTERPDGTWSKMLCIPKRWMKGVSSFTICGEKGHYYFNATETGYFKRQRGRLTSDDVARMWKGG